jgi:RNA polymerase sigma-70 factor (ECF subfamily)
MALDSLGFSAFAAPSAEGEPEASLLRRGYGYCSIEVGVEAVARDRSRLRVLPGGAPESAPSGGATDAELIEAVRRGDDRVARELYDRVIGVVDRTLVRIFGKRERDHDDLVQSTFEQVVKTLANRRFAGACSLPTWAARVATHVGLNALRSRRRERSVLDQAPAPDDPPASASVQSRLEARGDIERVRAAMAAMDSDKAEAVFLHDVLGHELAEIAVITGTTVAAAQSRLVRGRRELLERLQSEGVTP